MPTPIDNPAVQFRPATAADVDAAVPLIYSSGPAAFDYVFASSGKSAQDFLQLAFVRGDGEFGYRSHIVATVDGAVTGIGTAFSGDVGLSYTLAAARQILAAYGARAPGPIRRGLQVEGVVVPPKGDIHYLAHLGVAPEWRSHGIGTQLVDHLLGQGRALGRKTAALDVAVTNPRAQELYERLGFIVTGKRRSSLQNNVAAVADHRRMERPIE